jgi:hypothetical protein
MFGYAVGGVECAFQLPKHDFEVFGFSLSRHRDRMFLTSNRFKVKLQFIAS